MFRDGLDTPPLEEHLRVLDFALPELERPGRSEFAAVSLMGEVRAALTLIAASKPGAPVLIYHHEAGELPPTRTAKAMFARGADHGLWVYVVEAPFHDGAKATDLAESSLLAYLSMVAVAVGATQRLIERHAVAQAALRVVAGFGQGGFIANWHHMLYDTADAYIPFMAGTAPAETFLASLPVAASARRNAAHLRDRLNFDLAWRERRHDNVFPVLGMADRINLFDVQAPAYGRTQIEVWNTSHRAAARAPDRLRAKILKHIKRATVGAH
jgi:hypothetical protein